MRKAVSTGRNFTWFNTLPTCTIFRFRCWWGWNTARQTNIEVIHFPSFFLTAKNKWTKKNTLQSLLNLELLLFLLFFIMIFIIVMLRSSLFLPCLLLRWGSPMATVLQGCPSSQAAVPQGCLYSSMGGHKNISFPAAPPCIFLRVFSHVSPAPL